MNIVFLQSLGVEAKKLSLIKQQLSEKGHFVTFFDAVPLTETEAIMRAKDAEVLVVVNYPLTEKIINACPKLKMISVAFTGFDHIALKTCQARKIVVCNAAGYSTNSVAELAFGLMIAVLRNIIPSNNVVRKQGTRIGLIGNDLCGKTLGIIGTGTIGIRVAEIGKIFGCNLLGYNRTQKDEAKKLGIKYTDLKTLLVESDIITVHVAYNDQTKNLIDKKEFDLMKPSTIVIQTSRGGTINEIAFTEALNSGKIAGSGIDVFVQEPPLDLNNPLLSAKNTVLTPHVAFATKEALVRRADITVDNIYQWLKGWPQNRVC